MRGFCRHVAAGAREGQGRIRGRGAAAGHRRFRFHRRAFRHGGHIPGVPGLGLHVLVRRSAAGAVPAAGAVRRLAGRQVRRTPGPCRGAFSRRLRLVLLLSQGPADRYGRAFHPYDGDTVGGRGARRRGEYRKGPGPDMNDNTKNYDAVIIGAGPGGLSAGLGLARRGWKVLIAEKNPCPGGNCTARDYGGYVFDLAVHQLTGIGGGGMCAEILKEYGIFDKVEFRQVNPFLVVDMPDRSYRLPGDREGLRSELKKDFPEDAADIDRMLDGLATLKKDALISQRLLYGSNRIVDSMVMRTAGLAGLASFPFTFPWGIASRMHVGADAMLGRWIKNPRLRAVMHSSWIYLGLPPRRLSGVMMNVFAAMQHMEHSYYPVGGSHLLAAAFAGAIEERGGEILLDAPVKRIILEGGRAAGVELADGRTFRAGTVISNADARHTYSSLLGPGEVPARFARGLARMKPSMGPFRVCLGLDYDVSRNGLEEHEYMIYPGYDHEETYAAMERGEPAAVSAYSPTRISPELAPPGHSTLILTTLLPWKPERDWRGREEEVAAAMIAAVERKRLPGLSSHIKVKKIMTPGDLNRLTNADGGSMYGWSNEPGQVLTFRMSPKSPVKGLYHAGHWTRPGTGVTTAILSGWMLANRLNDWRGKVLDRIV
ncbi:MAG TPA: hypothetical protein DDW67_08065 [Elusimicrobia bacterium]|nr:hypothetical protein [Elusimicrobiota bacterium]